MNSICHILESKKVLHQYTALIVARQRKESGGTIVSATGMTG